MSKAHYITNSDLERRLDCYGAVKGEPGKDGRDGREGDRGERGVPGAEGKQGKQGCQGEPGIQGKRGEPGIDGRNGCDGKDGKDGRDGRDGDQGPQGIPGPKGCDGKDGAPGKDGCCGDAGNEGTQGEKGEKGDTGAQGVQGEQGEKGDTGLTGPQGVPGEQGEQGVPGDKGETGETGPQGVPGTDGANGMDGSVVAVQQAGTTTTLFVDNQPFIIEGGGGGGTGTVVSCGDGADANGAYQEVFFDGQPSVPPCRIYQGTQGIQGIQGIPGTAGTNGTNGINGTNGQDGADGTLVTVVQAGDTTTITVDGVPYTITSGTGGSGCCNEPVTTLSNPDGSITYTLPQSGGNSVTWTSPTPSAGGGFTESEVKAIAQACVDTAIANFVTSAEVTALIQNQICCNEAVTQVNNPDGSITYTLPQSNGGSVTWTAPAASTGGSTIDCTIAPDPANPCLDRGSISINGEPPCYFIPYPDDPQCKSCYCVDMPAGGTLTVTGTTVDGFSVVQGENDQVTQVGGGANQSAIYQYTEAGTYCIEIIANTFCDDMTTLNITGYTSIETKACDGCS